MYDTTVNQLIEIPSGCNWWIIIGDKKYDILLFNLCWSSYKLLHVVVPFEFENNINGNFVEDELH